MSHTVKEKQNLLLRAKRIQGQVEALVRVLSEERDCSEVLASNERSPRRHEQLDGRAPGGPHTEPRLLNGKHKPSSQQVVAADEVIDMVRSYLK